MELSLELNHFLHNKFSLPNVEKTNLYEYKRCKVDYSQSKYFGNIFYDLIFYDSNKSIELEYLLTL